MDRQRIERALQDTGLIVRGGFAPVPDDGLSDTIRTVVLIGNAGPELWRAFFRSPELDQESDPLDVWSRRVIGSIAETLGAGAIYPFDGPPYFPFQRWAMRADTVWPSPVGPLIHPKFGLWHAYRGALLFSEPIDFCVDVNAASPCETCADKPCLNTCPVSTFTPGHYDVPACARHLKSAAGEDCMNGGCVARRACPVGRAYHYGADHARFHMDHFLKNHS